jgi:hypothetical protein
MTKPMILIHNIETNKVIEREMTDEEFAIYQANAAAELEHKAVEQAAEDAKTSAQAKLAALGLSAEEIAALSK